MPRYAAFLRGVSPLNARMPEIIACFEDAGFADVRTLLSSGNVVFNARSTTNAAIERRAEKAMQARLGRSFDTYVRSTEYLKRLLEAEPFAEFTLEPGAKRVVTFLREPPALDLDLPAPRDGATILKVTGTEVLASYVPNPKGPVFMALLEKTFGKNITTRTLETVRKCAMA